MMKTGFTSSTSTTKRMMVATMTPVDSTCEDKAMSSSSTPMQQQRDKNSSTTARVEYINTTTIKNTPRAKIKGSMLLSSIKLRWSRRAITMEMVFGEYSHRNQWSLRDRRLPSGTKRSTRRTRMTSKRRATHAVTAAKPLQIRATTRTNSPLPPSETSLQPLVNMITKSTTHWSTPTCWTIAWMCLEARSTLLHRALRSLERRH